MPAGAEHAAPAAAATKDLLAEVRELSGERIENCYACGKCSAGCCVGWAMDVLPQQLMRYIQLGKRDEALRSHSIWLCVACEACTTRCPMDIDIAGAIDALRQIAVREGVKPAERGMRAFHDAVLGGLERFGRMNEVDIVRRYKMASLDAFSNLGLGMRLFAKGKLKFLRMEQVQGLEEIVRLFRYVRENPFPGEAAGSSGGGERH